MQNCFVLSAPDLEFAPGFLSFSGGLPTNVLLSEHLVAEVKGAAACWFVTTFVAMNVLISEKIVTELIFAAA